jgi:Xaa-Pro aminopeptidase
MTERQVAGVLQAAMLEGGAEQIAFILLNSGEGNYNRICGFATDRRVQTGDMIWTDMGARVNDYCADFSRAGVVGGPTDQQRRMQELIVSVTAKGVEAAGPGVPISDIVRACNAEMKHRGQENTFVAGRIGHGVGLSNTEPPHVALYDKALLEPGMVITIEPGIVQPYGTFHCEENVIITETGREVISSASRELWII